MRAKSLFIMVLPLFFSMMVVAQSNDSKFIYFNSDEYTLDSTDKTAIDNMVTEIQNHSDFNMTIIGHTDQDGSDEYNNDLAQKRANEVYQYLAELGLEENQVALDWKGESTLMDKGNSSSAKQKNRRVEINYDYYVFEETEEIIEAAHDVDIQKYVTSATEEKTLDLDNGSTLNIPSDCFEFADGSGVPQGDIIYEIKETFSFADFISEDLFTSSKGDILETGGMLYINATSNGKALTIKEGKVIEVIYPLQKTKEGMELFYASETEDGIDWTPTGEAFETSRTKQFTRDVDIDFTPLLNYEIDVVERPSMQFPPFPIKPKMMDKPYPPSEQVYEYQEKKYDKLYNQYLENLEAYSNRKPIYDAQIDEWEKKVDSRLGEVYAYKTAFRTYHAYAKTKGAIKSVQRMIGKKSNLEIISAFEAILSNPLELTIDDKKIFKAAFGNQTRDILRSRKIYPTVSDYRHYKNDLAHHLRAAVRQVKLASIEKAYEINGIVNQKDFGSYVGTIKTLGWINCDRFREFPEYMMTSIEIDDQEIDTRYYLIFKDIKSMLRPTYIKESQSFAFNRVPKKENVKIVAVKLINNKPHIAMKDHVISDDNNLKMNFVATTLNEIKRQLNSLDSYSSD